MAREHWDAIVIGTGFGGSSVALKLARAGVNVLVLERGRWVDRDDSAWDPVAIQIKQKYKGESRQLFAAEDSVRLRPAHGGACVSNRVQFGRHGKY